jgi:hypothetical protein
MELEALRPGNRNGVTITRHDPVVSLRRAEAKQPPSPEKESLPWIDTSRWDSEPCPEREWAVKDRIPLRQVTLFSGEGAIGKSIVELMCSVGACHGQGLARLTARTRRCVLHWL